MAAAFSTKRAAIGAADLIAAAKEVKLDMAETIAQTVYFEPWGEPNTERTLQLAKARADQLGIKDILVATTRGEVGRKAAELFRGCNVVVVTHVQGFKQPDHQELTPENRSAIEAAGGKILTTTHAFGSIGRAVRFRMNTYQLDEIIAYTLRNFCEGLKVCAEIAVMAADAGLVRTDKEVVAIAGTNRGADTSVVLMPAHTTDFFNLRILEIICKPRMAARKSNQ